jgi:hypothetical protein
LLCVDDNDCYVLADWRYEFNSIERICFSPEIKMAVSWLNVMRADYNTIEQRKNFGQKIEECIDFNKLSIVRCDINI